MVGDGGMRTGGVEVVGRAEGVIRGRGGREQRGQRVMRVVTRGKGGEVLG